jgi:hypothetical protein
MRENLSMTDAENLKGDSADLQRSLTQMANCLNELMHNLQAVTPGEAPPHIPEETRPLIKAINAQLNRVQLDGAQTNGDAPNERSRANGDLPFDQPTDAAGDDFAQRLRSQTDPPGASLTEFKRVMHWAIAAAQSGWQARLDADLSTATDVWNERIKTSIESSSQRAAELVMESSQHTARQLEQSIATHITGMSKSFLDASEEAENHLAAVRTSFSEEIKRAQEILDKVNATATTVDDQAARLAAITEIAQEELKRRGAGVLEWHSEELVRCAKQSVAEWNERLQTALETAGQRIVARLALEFEQQINSRLDRTRVILDRLEGEGRAAETLLRAHQGRMEKFSEQAVETVLSRLEKAGTDWESRIGDAGRAATNKWFAEIDTEPRQVKQTMLAQTAPVQTASAGQPASLPDHSGDIWPKNNVAQVKVEQARVEQTKLGQAKVESVETTISLGTERRVTKRLKIARPILARPEDPAYKETVETTRDASRYGVYFTTPARHYYKGMHIRVTLGYRPNDPCNTASFGKIVRIEPLENGNCGIAVQLMLR